MTQLVASGVGWRQGQLSPWAATPSLYVAMNDVGLVEFGGVGGRVQEQSTATGYLEAWHRTLGWEEANGWPSLSRQSEQPTQRLTAKARTSLRAMAPAGSALRGWGPEHPQGGRGLGSHPGESPAPFGGPLLPLPCLTHRPVPGALEEEPPVPSPATPSFECGRPLKWGQREEATEGRSGDPMAFPSKAFLPASARRGSPRGGR